ncbi:MAG: S8 family serine peptidase, partial [Blastocatellia bacterium]|nr:S8 family serine peptidase [Blastocatellia bacterium]
MSHRSKWRLAIVMAIFLSSLVWNLSLDASGKKGKLSSSEESAETQAVEATGREDAERPTSIPRNTGYRSSTERHKVQINDRQLAARIKGKLIGDYKSFQVYEVDTATLENILTEEKVDLRDEYNLVMLDAGYIDTTTEQAQALRSAERSDLSADTSRLHLIQFIGPVQDSWYRSLEATGVQIIGYLPSNSYLVYGDAAKIEKVKKLAKKGFVQWDAPYLPEYAIRPDLRQELTNLEKAEAAGIQAQMTGNMQVEVLLVSDPKTNSATIDYINSLGGEGVKHQDAYQKYRVIIANLPASSVKQIASRPDVLTVDKYVTPRLLDERQNRIISGFLTGTSPTPGDYLAWLTSLGFNVNVAASFGVDVSDDGIDDGANAPTATTHFGLRVAGSLSNPSRVTYVRKEGTGSGSEIRGCFGHGNINAHIIAGHTGTRTGTPHADSSGFRYGLGVAPFVRVGGSVIFAPGFTSPNYENLQARAYNDGMRISSNSWGGGASCSYNTDSHRYDFLVRDAQPMGSVHPTAGNQEMVIVFAAGNSGSSSSTIGFPATAKNVITVGASENVHPFGGADGCGIADSGADSAMDIIGFSSRGHCNSRFKPEIVAPGTHVTGGVFQQTASDAGTGTAHSCFDGSSVCGGVGSNFFPSGQQFYTASSGTSHSTPAVAGVAALLRQFHINNSLPVPSPAFTKAALINAARYMTGAGANDNLWSPNQGMGLVDMGRMFDSVPKIRRDQTTVLTNVGDTVTITGNVSNPSQPFRVTLAWTDAPPASPSSSPWVNDLDLEVTVGGNTYRGNVFSGANSVTGGTADFRTNAESVFVPAGVTGSFLVRVRATTLGGDGVPGVGDTTDQDFALIIYNGVEMSLPVIQNSGFSLVSEGCSPGNSAPDPGETVTVSLALQNVGTANTTSNVIATLQPTGGVTSPSGPQNYGILTAGGPAVTRNFTFTVGSGVTCGNQITLTFTLSGGATGNITVNMQTGQLAVSFAENFDSTPVNSLPVGWVATRPIGSVPLWTVVNTASHTAPNAAFTQDPSTVNDNRLDTPSFMVTSASAQLTFSHRYGFETGFDGGVLEIAIGSSPFQDILAAGGSFVTGGYTHTISTGYSNPIGGRQAWSGSTGTSFVQVTVNLPASANGQSVRLRFRMGSDSSVPGTGWWVDTIQVFGGFVCCGGPTGPSLDHLAVYVADTGNNRIQRTTDDGATWHLVGSGLGATAGSFNK